MSLSSRQQILYRGPQSTSNMTGILELCKRSQAVGALPEKRAIGTTGDVALHMIWFHSLARLSDCLGHVFVPRYLSCLFMIPSLRYLSRKQALAASLAAFESLNLSCPSNTTPSIAHLGPS